jgi:hypothetical protein
MKRRNASRTIEVQTSRLNGSPSLTRLARIGTELMHTETVVLLDRQRRIRGVYTGTLQTEPARIREDMEALLAEQ